MINQQDRQFLQTVHTYMAENNLKKLAEKPIPGEYQLIILYRKAYGSDTIPALQPSIKARKSRRTNQLTDQDRDLLETVGSYLSESGAKGISDDPSEDNWQLYIRYKFIKPSV